MQGRKHLTPKLRFTALLVLLTIQATSVDSSPAGIHPFRHPALLPRSESSAEPQSSVDHHLPDDRGLLSFFNRLTDDAKAANLIVSPGVFSEQSAADVPQELVAGPRRHFSTAFFPDFSQNRTFPNEHLLSRLKPPKLHFSGSVARERICKDWSCLPYLFPKLSSELRYLFYRAGKQLQEYITAYHNTHQRRTLPWQIQELRAAFQGVTPPDSVDLLLSWVEHYNVDPSSQTTLSLTDNITPVTGNDIGHPEKLYNWKELYRNYNDVYPSPNDYLPDSIFSNDLNVLNKWKRSVREIRGRPEPLGGESQLDFSMQSTELINDEVLPFLAESVFPLLVRISVSINFLDELINSLEVATSFPIRDSMRILYQKMASSLYGPLLKVLRFVYEIGTSVMPTDLLSSMRIENLLAENADTSSDGYLDTTVKEVFMETDIPRPRRSFRIWPHHSKRSVVPEEQKHVSLLIGPLEYITYITSWVDAGIMRAKSIDTFGTLDYFLKEAQNMVKQLSVHDIPTQLGKILKFAEVILDRIAPKEKQSKRAVPSAGEGNVAHRRKRREVNGFDKGKQSVTVLEDVILGEVSPKFELSRLWH